MTQSRYESLGDPKSLMRSTSEKDREDLVTRSSTEKQNRKRECVTKLSNREQVSIELNKYF